MPNGIFGFVSARLPVQTTRRRRSLQTLQVLTTLIRKTNKLSNRFFAIHDCLLTEGTVCDTDENFCKNLNP